MSGARTGVSGATPGPARIGGSLSGNGNIDIAGAVEAMANSCAMPVDVFHGMVGIVSAALSAGVVASTDVPAFMESVHGTALKLAGFGVVDVASEKEDLVPPVPIKKSITPDFLISLEDGKRYKSLKRHLSGRGLTPQGYREKWGLPTDYPMVAPNYAKARSELAKTMGLGRKPGSAAKAG